MMAWLAVKKFFKKVGVTLKVFWDAVWTWFRLPSKLILLQNINAVIDKYTARESLYRDQEALWNKKEEDYLERLDELQKKVGKK